MKKTLLKIKDEDISSLLEGKKLLEGTSLTQRREMLEMVLWDELINLRQKAREEFKNAPPGVVPERYRLYLVVLLKLFEVYVKLTKNLRGGSVGLLRIPPHTFIPPSSKEEDEDPLEKV